MINPKSECQNSNGERTLNARWLILNKDVKGTRRIYHLSFIIGHFPSGQSLFEVVFALGIAAIILIAIATLATSSVRNSNFSKESVTGTRLAQEVTEWLRQERDRDWSAFAARANAIGRTWCISALSWPGTSGGCGALVPGTNFTREITLTSKDLDSNSVIDAVDAVIVIKWDDAKGTHSVTNQTLYTVWRR